MSRNTAIQLDSIYSGFIHLLFRISSSLDLQQIDGSGWSRLNSSTNGSNCVFNGVQNEQSEPEISTERRNALMNKPSETDQPIHGNVRMPWALLGKTQQWPLNKCRVGSPGLTSGWLLEILLTFTPMYVGSFCFFSLVTALPVSTHPFRFKVRIALNS